MALIDEQILDLFNEACREKFNGLERFRHFARAVESEVRKSDEALIRQLVEALEGYRRNHNDTQPCDAEREGRAWLDGAKLAAAPTTQPAPQQEAQHLAQALTDRENQPNQYGVEFGMSGTHMHFKIGNQLFKLAYEPDEQDEFDFMKRMLVNAFTTFTHDVKIAPQPVVREPLTDAQIKGLIEEGVFFGNCKEIVRAIEAAHGIGITGGQHV